MTSLIEAESKFGSVVRGAGGAILGSKKLLLSVAGRRRSYDGKPMDLLRLLFF